MARGRSAMFQLPPPTPSRLPRVCACFTRAGSSCLWGGGAALKLAGRARRAALVVVSVGPIEEFCTGGRLLSMARSRGATFQLPPPTSNAKPTTACAASAHAPALAVSGEEAQYSSLLRARRAALVAVYLGFLEGFYIGGGGVSFDARSRATSHLPPPTLSRLPRVKQTHLRCFSLSLRRRRSTRAFCTRALAVLVVAGIGTNNQHCTGGRLSSSPRGRGAMSQLPPPTPSRLPRVCACFTRAVSSYLWGGGAALKLAGRARRAALVMVGLGLIKERCTDGRLLSFGARPWCDVPAAAFSANPAAACAASARAPALAVSGEEAQYSRLLHAHRAALIAVCLGPLKECCIGRGGLFFDARPRRDAQLPSPTPSRLPR